MTNISVNQILQQLMEEQKIDTATLAKLTDIPKRFVEALVKGNFAELPAGPYVRGYLFKIAAVLKTDPQILWQTYRRQVRLVAAGEEDKLPANRFALRSMGGRRLLALAVLIILLVFLGLRLNNILGKPEIEVSLPETTSSDTITVTGKIQPGDSLTLNNEVIYADETGRFAKEVQLEPGLNTLEFRAQRHLGRETKIIKRVYYQPVQ
jgi:hypothetical protein